MDDENRICVKDNINSSLVNLDAGNDFVNLNSNLQNCLLSNPVDDRFLKSYTTR